MQRFHAQERGQHIFLQNTDIQTLDHILFVDEFRFDVQTIP